MKTTEFKKLYNKLIKTRNELYVHIQNEEDGDKRFALEVYENKISDIIDDLENQFGF